MKPVYHNNYIKYYKLNKELAFQAIATPIYSIIIINQSDIQSG